MPIQFKNYSIPSALTKDVAITEEDEEKISKRSRKTNRKLAMKMRAIDRKDKRSWQKSLLRNSKR